MAKLELLLDLTKDLPSWEGPGVGTEGMSNQEKGARTAYEAQVKLVNNVNPSLPPEKQGALWKAGEIVNVYPKGWVWGRMEVLHFLIVNLGLLTESEKEELKQELTVDYEELDADGNMQPRKDFIARRRYQLDIATLLADLPDKTVFDVYDRDKEAQPFRQSAIELSNIEDITLRPEIQQKISDRKAVLLARGAILTDSQNAL